MEAQQSAEARIFSRVKDILDAESHLRLTKDGIFEGEIYADYRNRLENHTFKKLFKSPNPRELFDEMMSEWYMDSEWEYKKEIIDIIEKHFNDYDDDEGIYYDDHSDAIRTWTDENVYFNYPYKHYLNQDVYVDIIIDTGDSNYDYTMNELFGCNYSQKGYREESSVTWLMKQQGYSEEQIKDFIENENFQGSKLLKSVYAECLNTTTCMNALSFFISMTVEECFCLHEAINKKESDIKTITISKDSPCGLYDPWNGAGSVLDIKLEKDVVLPFNFIDSAYPDGCRGYGVDEIYGMMHSFWKRDCLKVA